MNPHSGTPSEACWGMFTIDQGGERDRAGAGFTYDTDGEPVVFLVPGAAPQPTAVAG